MSTQSTNQSEFDRAQKVLVGGVNSAVRAFRAVGGIPRFIARAQGAYMWDVEGKRYVDYLGSWGPMIVGHSHPHVVKRVSEAALNGLSYGAPNVHETLLAEQLRELFPQVEKVRFTSSGTESAMSVLRLARGVTGRDKIIKFEGCYHGTADSLLVKAGSGALAFGMPNSAGVPADLVQHTLVANYNDLDSVEILFKQYPDKIACLIIEPVAGNMNLLPPVPGFLQGLRDLCSRYGALLIFDEVMSGFRVALGGAQELYGVVPDLNIFGKVIGGGLPVGAVAGPAKYMDLFAPLGAVYQAGTLSGNPLAMAAGLATLELIREPGFYEPVVARCVAMVTEFNQLAHRAGVEFCAQSLGTMGGFYAMPAPPKNFADINTQDVARFKRFYHSMLDQGIYLPPSPFEAFFFSSALTDADIEQTLAAAKCALLA